MKKIYFVFIIKPLTIIKLIMNVENSDFIPEEKRVDIFPTSKDLPKIIEMSDGPEKEDLLLKYCAGHGSEDLKKGFFGRDEVVKTEVESFELLVGRPATNEEKQFLEDNI